MNAAFVGFKTELNMNQLKKGAREQGTEHALDFNDEEMN